MKNILEILKDTGIDIGDNGDALTKAVAENYKTVSEFNKKVEKLESERDSYKSQLVSAQEAIKGFEGKDYDALQEAFDDYKAQAEADKEAAKQALKDREFEDALNTAFKDMRFTSEYAKKAVMSEIKSAGLNLIDGKIIGLNDMIEKIKEQDSSAFVDEEEEHNKPKFSQSMNIPPKGTKLNPTELMKLKNQYPDLDITQYM